MSGSTVPAYVDTRKVFQQDAKISGNVALDRLPRFRELLADGQADIQITLEFVLNSAGRKLISGHLRAEVDVQCQRCLEPVRITLDDEVRLALIRDEAEAGRLEEDLDPWLSEDYKLDLAQLVEEQLILCMPIVSYHADASCQNALGYQIPAEPVDTEPEGEVAENPFAVLEKLKKKD